jgi:hypothetical protein
VFYTCNFLFSEYVCSNTALIGVIINYFKYRFIEMRQSNLDELLTKLEVAIVKERSVSTCLKLWSKFIRASDGQRCVLCNSSDRLSAHHIVRKSFLQEAKYMTGNGITLCSQCHLEMHEGFNGAPNFNEPMDMQGGEKIEIMTMLYGELSYDGKRRWGLNRHYYYLSEQVLCKFKMFQSYNPFEYFPGKGAEQAYNIWRATVLCLKNSELQVEGFPAETKASLPGITLYFKE